MGNGGRPRKGERTVRFQLLEALGKGGVYRRQPGGATQRGAGGLGSQARRPLTGNNKEEGRRRKTKAETDGEGRRAEKEEDGRRRKSMDGEGR